MPHVSMPHRSIRAHARAFVCLLGVAIVLGHPAVRGRAATSAPAARVVAAARALIGAPYAYIGDSPDTGFSCIGFVHYLYAQIGVDVPYDLDQAYAASPHVAAADLRPGDLVFFSGTVWNGLSHVALYVGDGWIIGADSYTTGVEMTRLSDPYWVAHYTGATRPLATTTPAPTSPLPRPAPPVQPRPVSHIGEILSAATTGIVYSGPGYSYPRIGRLPRRTILRVTAVQGDWTGVDYQGAGTDYYGWLDGPYVASCTTIPPSSPRRRAATAPTEAIVTVPILLLRRGPSTDQPVLRHMPLGERVAIQGHQGDWDRVRDNGIAGWAFARWLAPISG